MEEYSTRKNTRVKYDYNKKGAYFITICTKNRAEILSNIVGTGVLDGPKKRIKIELRKHGIIAEKYIKQLNYHYDNINVDEYVIMPDHIHIMLYVKGDGPSRTPVPTIQNSIVSRFISTFKRFTNKEYGENIWQYRSFDHIIRNEDDYVEHIKYIHENPIKRYYKDK